MNYLSDIPSTLTVIDTFLVQHARELPAEAVAVLLQATASPSPVDKIVTFGEAIYALGDKATVEAKTAAAPVVEFATRFSWHGLAVGGRGTGIVAAFSRDLGEPAPAGGWPLPKDDPAPRAELVAAITPTPAA